MESITLLRPLEEWARRAPSRTIPQLFRATVARHADRPYLGRRADGIYLYETYRQIQQKAHAFATSLIELGLEPGQRVAQLANNRPEWVITDLGVMHAGLVHVPLYPTLAPEAIAYILNDCQARVLVVGTLEQLQRVLQVADRVSSLTSIVVMEPGASGAQHDFEAFLGLAQGRHLQEMEQRQEALKATDLASLVYTSGTTGEPKGAMLRHGNLISNATEAGTLIGVGPQDVELSFLPLSHVFERMIYYAITAAGGSIGYAESIETVAQNVGEVRPTILASVPRLYEKMHARILDGVEKSHPLKRKLFHWAMGVGRRCFEAAQAGQVPKSLLLERRFAYKLVFSKIHQRLGGRIRYLVSGSAPLRAEVGAFFLHAGFKLLEGYGLTETSPIVTVNPPDRIRLGTVGRPLNGVEVVIASDGEILVRGPNVMEGYFGKPEATSEAIDPEGWFHTGDIGQFDAEGFLRITDRKKELLVLSNGKKVAPAPIELLLQASPLIEQAVVLGDNRNFVSALVVPAREAVAARLGVSADLEAMAANPQVLELLTAESERLCSDLSNYERVKKIALLPRELTQEAGDLTPTLKVKRRVVLKAFQTTIEGLYQE
jgi:long-chain acyl-CoA synthetase